MTTGAHRNGCFDRKPFSASQTIGHRLVLWGELLVKQPMKIANFSAADSSCRYTLSDLGRVDAGCHGCVWRAA